MMRLYARILVFWMLSFKPAFSLSSFTLISCDFSGSHVWMWELDCKEGWAQRIYAFELWCWKDSWESLGLQWDQRRSRSQSERKSTLKIHWKDMLKLKLQYFAKYRMRRADPLEKTLMLGKIEGRRKREQQRIDGWMAWTDTMDISWSKLLEVVKDSEAWRADEVTRVRHLLVTEQQQRDLDSLIHLTQVK